MRLLSPLLVALAGFTSLSYELLWTRAFGVMTAGRAFAFPLTLGLFLLGIALGARWSKKFSARFETGADSALRTVALFYGGACVVGYLSVPVMSWLAALLGPVASPFALYVVCGGAALFGAQFPLLAHHGIPPDREAGAHLSYLYIANIIGSVGGTLLTGFVLMDHFTLAELVTGFTVVGVLASLAIYLRGQSLRGARVKAVVGALILCAAVVAARPALFGVEMWQRLMLPEAGPMTIVAVVETKSGVVVEDSNGRVLGGGVYDGDFAVDLIHDVNGIIRPFSVAAFHPNPKKVLIIGLATGSWARAVAAHPSVEEMVFVEIDPGYLQLTSRHPEMQALLNDSRTRMVVDDGRRWLNANNEKFDVVVSNTTWHWRSMASGLMSVEFFELVKSRLNPNGIVLYNTTDSRMAAKAGLVSFEDTYAVFNTVVGSTSKMDYDPERLRKVLLQTRIDGKPMVDLTDPLDAERFALVMKQFEHPENPHSWVRNRTRLAAFAGDVRPTTDDNMGNEWELLDQLIGPEREDSLWMNVPEPVERAQRSK